MSVFKCKMCGGDLNITDGQTVAECEYCGSKQTVAGGDNEKKVNLFNRANRLRIGCEFDKAAGIYENIISEFPEEAEAYWGLCLCNYGIEYVDDPATANKVPTCHRASFKKLRKDANYEMALENADMNARIIYEEQAKEIDRIMGEILALSKDEEPYDIFICYKESDNSGARTPDSVLAQDIYDSLTQKGYRVFFSRITLEDKLGVHYEPYIFSALNSAKMMLVVGTDYEYMNAVWVRNEWSRFLRLMAEDKTKVLVPCYQNMDPYDMPDQFCGLQSQDCSKLGFMQDLVRGIDKIFGKSEKQSEDTKSNIQHNSNNPTIDSLLARMFMFLEDEKWESATEYANKVLDIDVKNAEAYVGLLMCDLRITRRENLAEATSSLEDYDNFKKIMRFGNNIVCQEIKSYSEIVNKRISDKAEMQRILNEKIRNDRKKLIEDIANALLNKKKINEISTINKRITELNKEKNELESLINSFDEINNKIQQASKNIDENKNNLNNINIQRESFSIFAVKERKNLDEQRANLIKKIESQNETINLWIEQLRGCSSKSDIEKKIKNIELEMAEAYQQLKKLNSVVESPLSYIEAIVKSKDPDIKAELFSKYPNLKSCFKKIGDIITFGNYYQNNTTNKEPIKWRILDVMDNKMLIISEYGLDCKQYNESKCKITWETSSLRKWLNGTFYKTAFDLEEQKQIKTTKVKADPNRSYSTDLCNDTTDNVFLLSITEVKKYFVSDGDMICKPTDYAIANGVYVNNLTGCCWWWLRSFGKDYNHTANIYSSGGVFFDGRSVDRDCGCVRPAMWIEIN